jgi:hypothetical protein
VKFLRWRPLWAAAALIAVLPAISVGAEEWVPLTGAEKLRNFVSGATAEIEMKPGQVVKGEYRADGTATITAWGETYQRTWEVRGDDQVCYSSLKETNCYTFEENIDDPATYRARHVETGEIRVFHIGEHELWPGSPKIAE